MKITILPGRYVAAVSGGVDSMVLLDVLRQIPDIDLVVAHFDHGIRADSGEDRRLVKETAEKYSLPFEYEEGKLGLRASEAKARKARYGFLERVRHKYQAGAIVTAHHRDDLLETAVLNILRGTGRKGLSSLADQPGIIRPLLSYSKAEILAYAKAHNLAWREDSTNSDDTYLRNYIRHQILPNMTNQAKRQLLAVLVRIRVTNRELDTELNELMSLVVDETTLDRQLFIDLPHDVAKELLATWLRKQGTADFDHRMLERVVIAAKTKPPGTLIDLQHGDSLLVTKTQLALRMCER